MSVTDTSQQVNRPGIDDVDSAYPLLVDNMGSRPSSSRTGATDDLGSLASDTISGVLGWRGRKTDSAGFQAALKASFALREVDGHVVADYSARSLSIQADLGALTGAQASLYARAKSTETLVMGLLDGLTVLDASADLDDTEALRRLVGESVLELVGELGVPSGPRAPRVNTLFTVLTGQASIDARGIVIATEVGGQLGQLRDRFGLVRGNINDLNTEQVYTSFFTIVDAISSLQSSWAQQRKAFSSEPGSDTYLGPELVLLSRDLAAASEQLDEVRFLLESVFIGPAEQQTILVHGPDAGDDETMALSDLMSWLEDFVNTRGPRLVSESGRDGIQNAFGPMAETLAVLVAGLAAGRQPGWPRAMSAVRVANGFSELSTYLSSVVSRVRNVTRYGVRVTRVRVVNFGGPKGRGRGLLVFGDGFLPEHSVVLRSGEQTAQSYGDYISTTGLPDEPQVLHVQIDAADGTWQLGVNGRYGLELAWPEPVILTSNPQLRPPPGRGGIGGNGAGVVGRTPSPRAEAATVIVHEEAGRTDEVIVLEERTGGGGLPTGPSSRSRKRQSAARTGMLEDETRTTR